MELSNLFLRFRLGFIQMKELIPGYAGANSVVVMSYPKFVEARY